MWLTKHGIYGVKGSRTIRIFVESFILLFLTRAMSSTYLLGHGFQFNYFVSPCTKKLFITQLYVPNIFTHPIYTMCR